MNATADLRLVHAHIPRQRETTTAMPSNRGGVKLTKDHYCIRQSILLPEAAR